MATLIENANPFGPLREDRLQALERKLEVSLPSDYCEFLRQYNGGRPVPSGFWIEEEHDGGDVYQFYGLHDGPKWLSIDGYPNAEWHIPENLLPVGDDGAGDLICLGIKGEEQGAIYFIDHEIHPYNAPQSPKGVTKIADSFAELLAMLKELPE